MNNKLKLKIKVGDAVNSLVEAVRNLKTVSIEVAAETEADDKETADLVGLISQVSDAMLPLEIINAKIKKDIEES